MLIKVPCSEQDRKKCLGFEDIKTFGEKTFLFKIKNNKRKSFAESRSPVGRKTETLSGVRSLKALNEEFTN